MPTERPVDDMQMSSPWPRSTDSVHAILATRSLRALFQPIVDLDSNAVVGYEALARGPVGTPLENPLDLFAAARREGLLAELDAACRVQAFQAAVDAACSRRSRSS